MWIGSLRQLQLELVEGLVLLFVEFGNASEPDLSSFDGWQHDLHTVEL